MSNKKIAKELVKIAKELTATWVFEVPPQKKNSRERSIDRKKLADSLKKGNIYVDQAIRIERALEKIPNKDILSGKEISIESPTYFTVWYNKNLDVFEVAVD